MSPRLSLLPEPVTCEGKVAQIFWYLQIPTGSEMSQSFYVLAFGRTGVRAVAPDKQNKLSGLSLLADDGGIVECTSFCWII